MKKSGALFVFLILGAMLGCSPQARHRVANILFDGVPPPRATPPPVVVTTTAVSILLPPPPPGPIGDRTREPEIGDKLHPPFKHNLCQFCHNSGGATDRLRYSPPNLCFQCHGRVDQMGPTVHWPVKQGRCVTCHNPHQAPNAKLLRLPVPRLCFQCHNPEKLVPDRDKGNCLDCHNPHSAKKPRLLKR